MDLPDFLNESALGAGPPDETPLETALRLANEDPTCWPDFYQELLRSNVVVITAVVEGGVPSHRELDPGEEAAVMLFSEGVVPVFTARARIFDDGDSPKAIVSVAMAGRALLEAARTHTVLLNPYSPTGITLKPALIERILAGKFRNMLQTLDAGAELEMTLGPPDPYPAELVEGVRRLLRARAAVQRAYLAQGLIPADSASESLMLGLELTGEDDSKGLLREIAAVARPLLAPDKALYFLLMDNFTDSDAVAYLRTQTPIFERE